MQCPRCHDTPLRAARLAGGLPGESCASCDGALVALLQYRDWVERSPEWLDDAPASPPPADAVAEQPGALRCPKCTRLMARYRIGQGVRNTLDLCTHCGEAWLDGGEWPLLRALQLAHQMPRIFTDPWQRRARAEPLQASRRERLRQRLGEQDAAKVQALHDWLKDHPRRADILLFLQQP